MGSLRKIASNLLWTPQGVVRDPLLTIADGRVVDTQSCPNPDREPQTEFYAGLLVVGFPADWQGEFARMSASSEPLDKLLRRVVPTPDGALVVIRGLDYEAMQLTKQSEIEKL